jgi:SpoVK/Ycf46/Vps4 family AAA+-type ATPase
VSDTTADTATPDAPADTTQTATDEAPDLTAELEKWKSLARKQEERAKANAKAAQELEQLKQQSMSDIERAVAEAKAEGRTEVVREASTKVALATLKAAAAGRFELTEEFLEGVNLAAFVDDDGEVDEAKVAKFIEGIAPKDEPRRIPDLGQGPRGSTTPLGSDPLLNSLKGSLGIH